MPHNAVCSLGKVNALVAAARTTMWNVHLTSPRTTAASIQAGQGHGVTTLLTYMLATYGKGTIAIVQPDLAIGKDYPADISAARGSSATTTGTKYIETAIISSERARCGVRSVR